MLNKPNLTNQMDAFKLKYFSITKLSDFKTSEI